MRIKNDYVLRCVADIWIVMALGAESVNFNGMLTLNETGALLWKCLADGDSMEAMTDALVKEYDVSYEQALEDVKEFCNKLVDCGCAEP